jgi:hypothetical protein
LVRLWKACWPNAGSWNKNFPAGTAAPPFSKAWLAGKLPDHSVRARYLERANSCFPRCADRPNRSVAEATTTTLSLSSSFRSPRCVAVPPPSSCVRH